MKEIYRVKIMRSESGYSWYANQKGAVFSVIQSEKHPKYWITADNKNDHIKKTDCEIINEEKTNNMSELKITKEKVLEASRNCPLVKETLKTLFPEAFEKEPVKLTIKRDVIQSGEDFMGSDRVSGKYRNKGIFLSRKYNWEIVKDEENETVLIAKEK